MPYQTLTCHVSGPVPNYRTGISSFLRPPTLKQNLPFRMSHDVIRMFDVRKSLFTFCFVGNLSPDPVKYSNLSVVYFRAEIQCVRSYYICFICLLFYASTSWNCSLDAPGLIRQLIKVCSFPKYQQFALENSGLQRRRFMFLPTQ